MYALAILTLFAVILPPLGIGPVITREGSTAHNSLLRVVLPPDAVTIMQGQSPLGRKMQEVCDWWLRWLLPTLLVWPIALLLEFPLAAPIFDIAVLTLVVVLAAWTEVFEATFDAIGHGVEIRIAEREGRDGYRQAEIKRMQRYSPAFKTWSLEQIDAHLRRWDWVSFALLFVFALRARREGNPS